MRFSNGMENGPQDGVANCQEGVGTNNIRLVANWLRRDYADVLRFAVGRYDVSGALSDPRKKILLVLPHMIRQEEYRDGSASTATTRKHSSVKRHFFFLLFLLIELLYL